VVKPASAKELILELRSRMTAGETFSDHAKLQYLRKIESATLHASEEECKDLQALRGQLLT